MTGSRSRFTIVVLLCTLGAFAPATVGEASDERRRVEPDDGAVRQAPPGYDAALAGRLGADDHGMKRYVLAVLKRGPNRGQSEDQAARLQRAHLDNIHRLAEEGKLLLAGPFLDDGEVRGIYVFDVRTVEEARALTETDPSIRAGRLVMELRPWYGSAALGLLNEWHSAVAKEKI